MMEGAELKSLIYDNTSGAREIAERSLGLLQRAVAQAISPDPTHLLDDLADVAVKVIRSKPEMPQVFQTLNQFFLAAEAEEKQTTDLGAFRIALLNLVNVQLQRFQSQLEEVALQAQPLIANGSVILTHSRSSSVLNALRRAKRDGKLFDVIVLESRPLLEGRVLARELAEDQIPVRLVVDAMMSVAVQGADHVLVGADALTPHGVVNKSGTHPLALAAKAVGVPLSIVAETSKAWVKSIDPKLTLLTSRLREPREVWDTPPYGVEVVNLYFESTPIDLIQSIACEEGLDPPEGFWSRVRSRGFAERIRKAFGDELAS